MIFLGNAGNALSYIDKSAFSTYDRDNDVYSKGNCANIYASGWWYTACHGVNLNGIYFYGYEAKPRDDLEIDWNTLGNRKAMKTVEMKMRRE